MTYICQYFSKTEDRFLQATKQAAKEGFENNMHHHITMKTIAKAYLNNRACYVEEVLYHILPESKLGRILLTVYFVNTNPPEKRVQLLLSEKELSNFSNDSLKIFKTPNVLKDQVHYFAMKVTVF